MALRGFTDLLVFEVAENGLIQLEFKIWSAQPRFIFLGFVDNLTDPCINI
jgi:hypothetical protein